MAMEQLPQAQYWSFAHSPEAWDHCSRRGDPAEAKALRTDSPREPSEHFKPTGDSPRRDSRSRSPPAADKELLETIKQEVMTTLCSHKFASSSGVREAIKMRAMKAKEKKREGLQLKVLVEKVLDDLQVTGRVRKCGPPPGCKARVGVHWFCLPEK